MTHGAARLLTYLERATDPETAGAVLREWRASHSPPTRGCWVDDHRVRSTQSVSRPKNWEVALVSEVCRSFGCTVLWESGRSQDEDYWGRYHVVGPLTAVEPAEAAVVALLKAVGRRRLSERSKLSSAGMTRDSGMTAQLDLACEDFVERTLAYLPRPPKLDPEITRRVGRVVSEVTSRSGHVTDLRANFVVMRHGSRRRP